MVIKYQTSNARLTFLERFQGRCEKQQTESLKSALGKLVENVMKTKIHWHFSKFDLLGKSHHDLCHFYVLELFDEINEHIDKSNSADINYLDLQRLSANLSLDSPLQAFKGMKQLRHEKESHCMIKSYLKDRKEEGTREILQGCIVQPLLPGYSSATWKREWTERREILLATAKYLCCYGQCLTLWVVLYET